MMGNDWAKEVFEQVKKSREADGEAIEGWRVTEHEDWLDVKKEAKDEEMDGAEEMEEHRTEGHTEDRERVVEAFRTAHPEIGVHLGDVVTVSILALVVLLLPNVHRSNCLHLSVSTSSLPIRVERFARKGLALSPQNKGPRSAGRFPASQIQATRKLSLQNLYWTPLLSASANSMILDLFLYVVHTIL